MPRIGEVVSTAGEEVLHGNFRGLGMERWAWSGERRVYEPNHVGTLFRLPLEIAEKLGAVPGFVFLGEATSPSEPVPPDPGPADPDPSLGSSRATASTGVLDSGGGRVVEETIVTDVADLIEAGRRGRGKPASRRD